MLRDIPLKFLLTAAFFISGLIPLLTFSLVSYETSVNELKNYSFKQLESVRKLKTQELQSYFRDKVAHLEVLTSNPFLIKAINDLSNYMRSKKWDANLAGLGNGKFKSDKKFKAIHDRYFPFFKNYIQKYELYDFLFINPDNGICYFSVKKENDFGIPVGEIDKNLTNVIRDIITPQNHSNDFNFNWPSDFIDPFDFQHIKPRH